MAKLVINSSNIDAFKKVIPNEFLSLVDDDKLTLAIGAYDDETGLAVGALLCSVVSKSRLSLRWIYVIEPKRNQGIGYDLLRTLALTAKKSGFEEIEYYTGLGRNNDVVKFLSDNYFYFESADKEINTVLDVNKIRAEDCLRGLMSISDILLL